MARGQLEFPKAEEDAEPHSECQEAMAAFGLVAVYPDPADLPDLDDEFWLWPENEDVFSFWMTVQTQWLVGMNGATGLNYCAVDFCMRILKVRKKHHQRYFAGLQAMEHATLDEWAKTRR